jgi:DNA-directed RNA polymerase specialized sigma subunit
MDQARVAARRVLKATARYAVAEPVTENSAAELDRMVGALADQVLAGIPRNPGLEMVDLIQAGKIGLLSATRTYGAGNGASLAAYARFRIRGEMLDRVRMM